jgi:hypothetical protein
VRAWVWLGRLPAVLSVTCSYIVAEELTHTRTVGLFCRPHPGWVTFDSTQGWALSRRTWADTDNPPSPQIKCIRADMCAARICFYILFHLVSWPNKYWLWPLSDTLIKEMIHRRNDIIFIEMELLKLFAYLSVGQTKTLPSFTSFFISAKLSYWLHFLDK